MTVCIPVAADQGRQSRLFPHFGSAPMFAIIDTETTELSFVEKPCGPHGTCAPVDILAQKHVNTVIVGGIGGGAIHRLRDIGATVYLGRDGTIETLTQELKNGNLSLIDESDACGGHHHQHHHE
jgi:predicted Fe-Mo cluster-binding NifX family protein